MVNLRSQWNHCCCRKGNYENSTLQVCLCNHHHDHSHRNHHNNDYNHRNDHNQDHDDNNHHHHRCPHQEHENQAGLHRRHGSSGHLHQPARLRRLADCQGGEGGSYQGGPFGYDDDDDDGDGGQPSNVQLDEDGQLNGQSNRFTIAPVEE